MANMTLTDFNRNSSRAAELAAEEPLIVTRRGEPAFVLMGYAEYQRITKTGRSIYDSLRPSWADEPDAPDLDLMELIGPRVADPMPDPFADWDDAEG